MNQRTEGYARALVELKIPFADVQAAEQMVKECPLILDALSNPTVSMQEKDRVTERLFPESLHGFFKVLCRNGGAEELLEIFRDYFSQWRRQVSCIKATVEYVTPLTAEQREKLIALIKRKTGYPEVELSMKHRPELLGGFVLRAGDFRYDRSTVRAMAQLKGKLMRQDAPLMTARQPSSRILRATMEYVTMPTPEQVQRIEDFIRKKTGYREIELRMKHCPELIGGFVLRFGTYRYDRSTAQEVAQLRRTLMRR